jgi:uncharacterized membrane protein
MMADDKKTTGGTGLPKNTAAALAYLLGWLTGIVMLLVEKDPFVRFHALQSIAVFGGLMILQLIMGVTLILAILVPLVWIVELVLWLVLMWKAYQGEEFQLPLIGPWAKQQAAKMG